MFVVCLKSRQAGAVGRLPSLTFILPAKPAKLEFHFACKPSSLLASPRKNESDTQIVPASFFPIVFLLTKTASACMRGPKRFNQRERPCHQTRFQC